MTISPFTQCAITALRKLYPESLADKSFDNTGALLVAPISRHAPPRSNKILLTIDLTRAVARAALSQNVSLVVAYHPIIFRGLKSLTPDDPQQKTLLELAQAGVSVYCPHTAVDTVPGGMCDWLADVVAGDAAYEKSVVTASPAGAIHTANGEQERGDNPFAADTTGQGRFGRFKTAQRLTDLLSRDSFKKAFDLHAVSLAVPQDEVPEDIQIKTFACCNGSGSSVLSKCSELPDLIVTGEFSHHEALAVIERGGSVVTLFHSNSERGYLRDVMRNKLHSAVDQIWSQRPRDVVDSYDGVADQLNQILAQDRFEILVSYADLDPYQIWSIE